MALNKISTPILKKWPLEVFYFSTKWHLLFVLLFCSIDSTFKCNWCFPWNIPNRVDIEDRPTIVDLKEKFGDLEIDTVIGSNHKAALVTINDRLTSKVWIRKLSGKDAIPLALKTIPYKETPSFVMKHKSRDIQHHKTYHNIYISSQDKWGHNPLHLFVAI